MSGSKTRREYSNLDSVFNKLQVSSSTSLDGCSTPTNENATSHSLRISESTSMSIGERLKNKRRKKTTKCIVKKAKLILPKTFTTTSTTTVNKRRGAGTLNKHKNNNHDEDDDEEEDVDDKEEDEVFLDNSSDSDVSITETPGTPSSCSAQYLNTAHSVAADPNTTDSSNPEELAAYFEQMLFIPKPMSLMAQMMYA